MKQPERNRLIVYTKSRGPARGTEHKGKMRDVKEKWQKYQK